MNGLQMTGGRQAATRMENELLSSPPSLSELKKYAMVNCKNPVPFLQRKVNVKQIPLPKRHSQSQKGNKITSSEEAFPPRTSQPKAQAQDFHLGMVPAFHWASKGKSVQL